MALIGDRGLAPVAFFVATLGVNRETTQSPRKNNFQQTSSTTNHYLAWTGKHGSYSQSAGYYSHLTSIINQSRLNAPRSPPNQKTVSQAAPLKAKKALLGWSQQQPRKVGFSMSHPCPLSVKTSKPLHPKIRMEKTLLNLPSHQVVVVLKLPPC